MQKTKKGQHSSDDDSDDEIEITVRFLGRPKETLRLPRGTRLKDFLKSRKVEIEGLTFYYKGKKLAMTSDGDLEENPELEDGAVLEVLNAVVLGGER